MHWDVKYLLLTNNTKNLSQTMIRTITIKQLMTHRHGAGDSKVCREVNDIFSRSRVLSML